MIVQCISEQLKHKKSRISEIEMRLFYWAIMN